MALSNAERQKAYRDRKRGVAPEQPDPPPARPPCLRCLELEEEVRHLKAELAKRPVIVPPNAFPSGFTTIEPGFNSRPFTPVPKVRPSH